MKNFLDRNPGLASRIAHTVHFPDYSEEELYQIAVDIASENGYVIDAAVKEKLLTIFAKARKDKSFGNGRFVRNIVEQAQAQKALSIDFSKVDALTDDELFLLTAEDFSEICCVEDHVETKVIGF